MKTFYQKSKLPSAAAIEQASEKILAEKMGLLEGEFREINDVYGVSATQLLELMRMSKYQFIFPAKVPGQCEPCSVIVQKGCFLQV
jgi:hypothetical protein